MIVGNDLSEYQGVVNFDTYKNNTHFVAIRGTIGTARVDNQFLRNRSEARRVGLPLIIYHYSYPQYNTPEAEADYLVSQADIQENEILALDFEENWSGDWVDFCKRFLDRVSAKLDGYKPLIYLNQSQLQSHNWQPVADAGYGLWVAAYTYDPGKNNFVTGAWKFAAMQQWTNEQQVPGIQGKVDGDVFFGDKETLLKYGYHKPAPPPDYKTLYEQAENELAGLKAQLEQANKDLQGALAKIANAKQALG